VSDLDLLIRDARVVTPTGPARGCAMGTLRVIPRASVGVRGDRIAWVRDEPVDAPSAKTVHAAGRVLLPGFVDAHTHALWAGDRLDEWDRKRAGDSYLSILEGGGGIMSTVRAVRGAARTELEDALRSRLRVMLREGSTTVEIKSGYGLSTHDELKMLHAIAQVAGEPQSQTIIPTALLGHALDPGLPPSRFIRGVIDETLPAVHADFPALAIDAYCEQGAWPLDACIQLLEKALTLGHRVRVHTDQFHSLGMTQWAVAHGALSVDHLEASTPETLRLIAAGNTFAVLLPCSGFHTDGRYANGRSLADAGAKIVVATNCNPGSAPCSNMPMAIALAVRGAGLTLAEAICATTANPAELLGFSDRGAIAQGMRADLILLRHRDERLLACEFGGDPVDVVIHAGTVRKE